MYKEQADTSVFLFVFLRITEIKVADIYLADVIQMKRPSEKSTVVTAFIHFIFLQVYVFSVIH